MGKTGRVGRQFYSDERCAITELWNAAGDPAASLARCAVQPGTTTQLHSLSVAERYIIESGSGVMQVGADKFDVRAGDVVFVPAGAAQCITATGAGELVFLVLCTPRFAPASYRNLESGG